MTWLLSFLSIFAGWIGLKKDQADAAKVSTDQQAGVTAQTAADLRNSNAIAQAELAATKSGGSHDVTDSMRDGTF